MRELDFRKFDNSMETIKEAYVDMYKTYAISAKGQAGVKQSINDMKNGWKSVNGYKALNKLSEDVANALDKGSDSILKCYGNMKDTMRIYAKKEGHPLIVGSIGAKKYESVNQADYDEKSPIYQDDATVTAGKKAFVSGINEIIRDLDRMIEITETDAKFGYTDDGGANPRQAMHDALVRIKGGLKDAVDNYTNTFSVAWDEDKKSSEAILAEGASDMSAINFD